MSLLPLWDPAACVPRSEVLEGTLTDADLALSLSAIVWGGAKPPYNDPRTFFASTHLTRNMRDILQYLFGRISRARTDTNPVVILDVGFGGGKTHTMATLYYAAKYGQDPSIQSYLSGTAIPENVQIVAISGDEYGSRGITRDSTAINTLWGDVFYQLGCYDQFKDFDLSRDIPEHKEIKNALGEKPLLILFDELPTYLNLVGKHDRKMMDRTVHFIQRLVNGVAEKENAGIVIAIAETAYRSEAILAKESIKSATQALSIKETQEEQIARQASQEALEDARELIRRKEYILSPVEEDDAVHILKRRLFSSINADVAAQVAGEYHTLYTSIAVPDKYKKAEYRDKIEECYPFHPELISVLYERIATIDRFNHTRGALRLLTRVIRKIYKENEPDAFLIHPYHIDLAIPGNLEDLTKGIGEERMRNAVEADIWRSKGGATAQELDKEVAAQWKAPLHLRTCNTIYLYSLATGREGDHGINADDLTTLIAVPRHSDYALRVRDSVFRKFTTDFHYIDRRGTNFLFIREPNPLRVIDREARNVTDTEATKIVKDNLEGLFSDKPDWIHVDIFPIDPSRISDEPQIKLAILNPHLHHFLPDSGDIPENVERFITFTDTQGTRFRKFKNDTFLLVAEQSRMNLLWDTARKIKSATEVRKKPEDFGIPKDRKTEVEEYLSDHQKAINDHVRSAFCKFIYYNKKGEIQVASLNPNGYSNGKKGKEMFEYHLIEVFGRTSKETFDPTRVETDAWTMGAPIMSTSALFGTFHKKPGLTIPATQKIFRDTVLRGIEEHFWVLKFRDTIFTDENLPSTLGIDDEWEIWKLDEARKRGLLEKSPERKSGETGKGVYDGGTKPEDAGPKIINYAFPDSPADLLVSDLEKYTKRENIKSIDKTTLKSHGDPTVIYAIKNLLTRVGPMDCTIRLIITSERYNDPRYSISTDITSKENSKKQSAKEIIEIIPKLQDAEDFTTLLTLEWPNVKVDTVSQLLREIPKTNSETLFTLEISGMKE